MKLGLCSIGAPSADEIKRVLLDPEIWERETDDHCGPASSFPGLPDTVRCLGGYVEDAIIGLAMTHKTEVGTKIHFAVLRPYRAHARAFLMRALEILGPVYCDIPECYRAVINFALHAGFVATGRAGRYLKHGISHQRTRLCRS
ncbi:MAG: hypothetical protein Q8R92_13705 [Deltaproteobacteria bacterium]|nr:hypothetical protein [Deltaproteobacteria bacterium]